VQSNSRPAAVYRPTLRPRLTPGVPDRSAGLGGLYDHTLLGRTATLPRRDPLITTGDYLLSREREALAQRFDTDLYRDSYRALGAASAATARYDYAGDRLNTSLGSGAVSANYLLPSGARASARSGSGQVAARAYAGLFAPALDRFPLHRFGV